MGVSINIGIEQNSQSVANNTSDVTVTVTINWSGGSYNHVGCWLDLYIDHEPYGYTVKINPSKTTSGSEQVVSETVTIAHNADGTKKLECSASLETGVSSGTVYASASMTLTTIPRGSSLSITSDDSAKPLDGPLKLAIDRASSSFTHTLTYKCGSVSGTILDKSSSVSTNWTPPLTLAQQNTKGTSVPISFTLTTYSGDTSVGTATAEVTCSIPASVAPTVSAKVTDTTGYYDAYGAYIQSQSALSVELAAEGAQGSTITGYSTDFDGKTYTQAAFTVDAIKGSGSLQMTVTVKDSRSRTAKLTVSLDVLDYELPKITALTASRCEADGALNSAGDYLKVVFSASVSPLNDQNSAEYALKYKKAQTADYTQIALPDYSGNYDVTSGSYIFAAEAAYSYDILITITDDFRSISKSIVGSSRTKTWSILGKGLGFAFGKVAELAGYLDMGWHIHMNGNKLHGLPEPEEDDAAATKGYVDAENETLSAVLTSDLEEISADMQSEFAVRLQMAKLWQNSSPGSSFAAQTVSVDLSGYTHVGIIFKQASSASFYYPLAIYKKGLAGAYTASSSGTLTRREISSIGDASIVFEDGLYYDESTGANESSQATLIPYCIYGIKGVT